MLAMTRVGVSGRAIAGTLTVVDTASGCAKLRSSQSVSFLVAEAATEEVPALLSQREALCRFLLSSKQQCTEDV